MLLEDVFVQNMLKPRTCQAMQHQQDGVVSLDAVICVAALKPVKGNEPAVWSEDALPPVGSRPPELSRHCWVGQKQGQPNPEMQAWVRMRYQPELSLPDSMVCVCLLMAHGVGQYDCLRVAQCSWMSLPKGPSWKKSDGALHTLAK